MPARVGKIPQPGPLFYHSICSFFFTLGISPSTHRKTDRKQTKIHYYLYEDNASWMYNSGCCGDPTGGRAHALPWQDDFYVGSIPIPCDLREGLYLNACLHYLQLFGSLLQRREGHRCEGSPAADPLILKYARSTAWFLH